MARALAPFLLNQPHTILLNPGRVKTQPQKSNPALNPSNVSPQKRAQHLRAKRR